MGIGGVSRAGKSSLAKKIALTCRELKVLILDQDDYIFPTVQLPRIKNHINWEHPDTLDLDRLLEEINRARGTADMVIVEGIFAFNYPALNAYYTHAICIDLPEEDFIQRKKQDVRWGKEPMWYIKHIWKSFLKFGQPFMEIACLRVSGKQPFEMEAILSFLGVK